MRAIETLPPRHGLVVIREPWEVRQSKLVFWDGKAQVVFLDPTKLPPPAWEDPLWLESYLKPKLDPKSFMDA